MSTAKLTPQQERFVCEYLVDLNATAAYRRAGYKVKNDAVAAAAASRLLADVKIAGAVRAGQEARSKRTALDADYVLTRLRENVERSMQAAAVLDKQGKPTGEYRYEGAVANKALELLGKHLGLFVERHEVTGKGGGPMQTEVTHDIAERLRPYLLVFDEAARDAPGGSGGGVRPDGDGEPVDTPEAD